MFTIFCESFIILHGICVLGLGCMTWSPLACGFLTGKYDDGVPIYSRAALKVSQVSLKVKITCNMNMVQ